MKKQPKPPTLLESIGAYAQATAEFEQAVASVHHHEDTLTDLYRLLTESSPRQRFMLLGGSERTITPSAAEAAIRPLRERLQLAGLIPTSPPKLRKVP